MSDSLVLTTVAVGLSSLAYKSIAGPPAMMTRIRLSARALYSRPGLPVALATRAQAAHGRVGIPGVSTPAAVV
jgi:hypothetical protein